MPFAMMRLVIACTGPTSGMQSIVTVDRVYFLAGDAAHRTTHCRGQGMNTGIQDAYKSRLEARLPCGARLRY